MSEKNVGKSIFIGFLAGGAISTILALLYVSKRSKKLRSDIKEKTNEYSGDTEKYIAEAKDKAKDMINEGKKKSGKLICDAKNKSEEFFKGAEKKIRDAKSKAAATINVNKENLKTESGRLKNAVKAGVDAYKSTKNA
jgi:gas vesicle protein